MQRRVDQPARPLLIAGSDPGVYAQAEGTLAVEQRQECGHVEGPFTTDPVGGDETLQFEDRCPLDACAPDNRVAPRRGTTRRLDDTEVATAVPDVAAAVGTGEPQLEGNAGKVRH